MWNATHILAGYRGADFTRNVGGLMAIAQRILVPN